MAGKSISIEDMAGKMTPIAVLSTPIKGSRAPSKPGSRFVFSSDESFDQTREMVREALKKQQKKLPKGVDSKSDVCYMHAWVEDISPTKVIFNHNGEVYGANWSYDLGTKQVTFSKPVLVHKRTTYES